jgi:flagellar motor switch protein FliG
MPLSPTLRKAAILISSLDVRTADALLEQMGEAQAQRVRDAVMELGEVPAEEQEQIIAEFEGRLDSRLSLRESSVAADGGVELALSTPVRIPSKPVEPLRSTKPFAFFHDAASDLIARHLQREHPQTIALVISHLPPPRSAAVVMHFSAELQADVLLRVADCDEFHPEIVREVERGLEAALARELSQTRRRGNGTQKLQAILEAAGDSKEKLAEHVVKRDPVLAATIKVPRPQPQPIPVQAAPPQPRVAPIRRASETVVEFAQLNQLDDRGWAKVLKAADMRIALLALAGATPELVNRLLSQLPPPEARALERRIEAIGPVRLREIEHAQEQLARIAAQLAARGEIRLPRQRPFATAA